MSGLARSVRVWFMQDSQCLPAVQFRRWPRRQEYVRNVVMDKLTELERNLLELTRKHIQNEKELSARLEGSKLEPINLKTKKEWVSANFEIEEKIRELLGERTESLRIQDPLVRDQLKRIKYMKSKTRKYNADIEFSELAITLGIREGNLQKLFRNEKFREKVNEILTEIPSGNLELNEEEKIRESQELDEMSNYSITSGNELVV